MVPELPNHALELAHPDRETWTARCSCGRWQRSFSLDDVPLESNGDLKSIAAEALGRRHQEHIQDQIRLRSAGP